MSSSMITGAIYTFNRHELLSDALEGMLAQDLDRRLFNVSVVGNLADCAAAGSFYRKA
jgi:hypothetical protein